MLNCFMIRLGAGSQTAIQQIDAQDEFSTNEFTIDVSCKQVPGETRPDDIAIIWLGTNNNKGGRTPWKQGIRAIGRICKIKGEGSYNSVKTIRINIGVILPQSVAKNDIIKARSDLYAEMLDMPVLGTNNYSSQVVQKISPVPGGRNLLALFHTLEALSPGFQKVVVDKYPELELGISEGSIEPDKELPRQAISLDEENFDDQDESDHGIDVPFDPTKIDIIVKPMTISTLEARLENDELNLSPDFQRQANVWDIRRKGRLIESILLKIPLPSFYFSEDSDGGFAVVDGLQRLCSIFHFMNRDLLVLSTGAQLKPMRLKGLQYLKDLEGLTFQQLDRKFQRRVSELEIAANVIRANTPSAVKFNVFARLNQGGLPLNAQEIRNAIFPGQWRNKIRILAESTEFKRATGWKVPTARQQDMALVLRYVALWQLPFPHHRSGRQTLDEFLNATVENQLSCWSDNEWNCLNIAFYRSIDAVLAVRGTHAFRKSSGDFNPLPINRGLFEAELIVIGSLPQPKLEILIKERRKYESIFISALGSNTSFSKSLLYGTGSTESSNARIDKISKIVAQVTGDTTTENS